MLGELGCAEFHNGAADSSLHLREALDALEDPAASPATVLAYSQAAHVAGPISTSTLELLRRTSVRAREVDLDLHWRLEAQMIIAAQFDPDLADL